LEKKNREGKRKRKDVGGGGRANQIDCMILLQEVRTVKKRKSKNRKRPGGRGGTNGWETGK